MSSWVHDFGKVPSIHLSIPCVSTIAQAIFMISNIETNSDHFFLFLNGFSRRSSIPSESFFNSTVQLVDVFCR